MGFDPRKRQKHYAPNLEHTHWHGPNHTYRSLARHQNSFYQRKRGIISRLYKESD